jgi:hypothetical protein
MAAALGHDGERRARKTRRASFGSVTLHSAITGIDAGAAAWIRNLNDRVVSSPRRWSARGGIFLAECAFAAGTAVAVQ